MKKIMLGFAIAGVCAFTSPLVHAQNADQAKAEIAIPEPPKFASEDVNKGLGEFVQLIKEYGPAIRANDAQALQSFAPKMQEWEKGAASWATTLSPEDQNKLQSYMQEVGAALQPSSPAAPTPVQEARPIDGQASPVVPR